MMNYIFDLDGTLVTQGQPVSENIASQLIHLARENRVIFASARPVRDMLPLLPASLQGCLMVGCNGGMAWQDGRLIFARCFDQAVAADIIHWLIQRNIPYLLDGHWHYAVSARAHAFHDDVRRLSAQEIAVQTLLESGVTKILVLDGATREAAQAFLLRKGICCTLNRHKPDDIYDIIPQQENKYLSLRALGVDFSSAMVFGNDENDYMMLDQAAVSVFVGDIADYPSAACYCRQQEMAALLTAIAAIE